MARERSESIARDAVLLLVVGVVLGFVYNYAGLKSQPPFGLDWIAEEKKLVPWEQAVKNSETSTVQANLPAIPDLPHPIQMQLPAVKQFFDAGAALLVDAREPMEYEEGHIAGAISIPYEEATPDQLELLDPGGRPIITYCSGGECELSLNLAWDLIHAGHSKVLVFMGGFPEWAAAGHPVVGGTEPGGSPPGGAVTAADGFTTEIDDPMAFFGGDETPVLPVIPDLDRPMEMELSTVKQFVDARAALILDARESEEYEEGHIPGALHFPFDEVIADPLRLESLEAGDRPIIAYCGGGECELSLSLAYALVEAGHRKVLVFTGGYPEWEAAGYPVAQGREEVR